MSSSSYRPCLGHFTARVHDRVIQFTKVKIFGVQNSYQKKFYIMGDLDFNSTERWQLSILTQPPKINLNFSKLSVSIFNYKKDCIFKTERYVLYSENAKTIFIPSRSFDRDHKLFWRLNETCKFEI